MVAVFKEDFELFLKDTVKPKVEASIVRLDDGAVGWYRQLDRNDTIGVVASAQMLLVSDLFSSFDENNLHDAVDTLVKKQHDDGSWPFISNLSGVGVVDSTAISLLALKRYEEDENVSEAIVKGLNWLETNSIGSGGWGIVAGSKFRVYSTCLALQALNFNGRHGKSCFRRGLKELVAARDARTLLWKGGDGVTSFSASAVAVQTLSVVVGSEGFSSLVKNTAAVLREELNNPRKLYKKWEVEEVELFVGSERKRVEYKHYTLPLLMTSLLCAQPKTYDELLVKCAEFLRVRYLSDECITSWELHDVAKAMHGFLLTFNGKVEGLVLHGSRVVVVNEDDGKCVRLIKQYRKWFYFLSGAPFLTYAVWFAASSQNIIGLIVNFAISVSAGLVVNKFSK